MRSMLVASAVLAMLAFAGSIGNAAPAVGAAPKGDALAVASRVIKTNFPNCKNVKSAKRSADGSIRATCDNVDYLVFTVFNAKEGKTIELAMNCVASKRLLNVSC